MKKRTRVVAWLNIIPSLLLAALTIIVPGVFALFGHSSATSSPVDRLVGMGALASCAYMSVGIMALPILPWIYLLKKRAWAWWVLTVLYGIGAAKALDLLYSERTMMVTAGGDPLIKWGLILLAAVLVIEFIVLISDRPSSWRSKRKASRRRSGTRRRRRKSSR